MSLKGAHVLITRSRPQGELLCEDIKLLGGIPHYLPTMEIILNETDTLKSQIKSIDSFQWIIFISPQAASFFIPLIDKPLSARLVTVGAGTAKILQAYGYHNILFPLSDWRTEGLLELPEFHNLCGQKVAIIGGLGGRELLAETLKQRGAIVEFLVVYQRVLPANILKLPKVIDVIVVTSQLSLKNLMLMIDKTHLNMLLDKLLIVSSDRIAHYAKSIGFNKIGIATNASDEQVLKAIQHAIV